MTVCDRCGQPAFLNNVMGAELTHSSAVPIPARHVVAETSLAIDLCRTCLDRLSRMVTEFFATKEPKLKS